MTFWMRVLAAAVLIVFFGLGASLSSRLQPALFGRELFIALNGVVYYLIWLGVPLLVADSISREKREGTLGLLFLTPLSAFDVVVGKGTILGLRAFGILLAGLPVLVLPFLLGGVSWRHALFMLVAHLLSLFVALGAGLTASALSRRFVRAVLTALGLSALLSLLFNLGLVAVFRGSDEGVLFGPSALADGMKGFDARPSRPMLFWAGFLVAALLTVSVALLGQVIRQIEAFWQDAPVTTGRARAAAGTWFRLLARLVVGAVLVLVSGLMAMDTQRGAMLALAVASVLLSLTAWIGVPAWVIQRATDEAASQEPSKGHRPQRFPEPEVGQTARRTSWWRRRLPGAWGATAAVAFLVFLGCAMLTEVVSWPVAMSVIVGHLSAAMLAFGAGSLAWGWGRSWVRAWVRSVFTLVALLLMWCFGFSVVITQVMFAAGEGRGFRELWEEGMHVVLLVGSMVGSGAWMGFGIDPFERFDGRVWLFDTLLMFMTCSFVSLGLWLVGRWLENRPSRREEDDPGLALTRDLSEPVMARGYFRRRRQRVLETNPMRWLLERSKTSRLHRTGWLAVVAVSETIMVSEVSTLTAWEAWTWNSLILFGLSMGLAFAAAMSFQEEKRTGAMELILITPLTLGQIIRGRWRGLLAQFGPALGLVLAVCVMAPIVGGGVVMFHGMPAALALAGLASFVSVPALGMLWSIRTRSTVLAWLLTVPVVLLNLLLAGSLLAGGGFGSGPLELRLLPQLGFAVPLLMGLNLLIAGAAARWMRNLLRRREMAW